MFTFIKWAIFNFPLIIVDIIALENLEWGSQVYMTCLESMTISIISLCLMAFEYYEKDQLMLREVLFDMDKMDVGDDKRSNMSYMSSPRKDRKNKNYMKIGSVRE